MDHTEFWGNRFARRWPEDLRRKYCIGWPELTTEQEDVFWRWAEEQGLVDWLRTFYPCETELYYGNRQVTPEGHGPDADEPEDPNEA